MTARLIGIARVRELRAPLEQLEAATISVAEGIAGDVRGRKPGRQVSIVSRRVGKTPAATRMRRFPGPRGAPISLLKASTFRTEAAGG
jgi:hypothetical protein